MNEKDLPTYLFHQGTNYHSYDLLGCNILRDGEEFIISFCVWAPNADAVYLTSDIFGWDKPKAMKRIKDLWIFEFKDKCNHEGACYKYLIEKNGRRTKE